MENYLIPRVILEKVIDGLVTSGQLKLSPNTKQDVIKNLDSAISQEIFGGLNAEQLEEINFLLDSPQTSEDDFGAFFVKHNINLEKEMQKAISEFVQKMEGEHE